MNKSTRLALISLSSSVASAEEKTMIAGLLADSAEADEGMTLQEAKQVIAELRSVITSLRAELVSQPYKNAQDDSASALNSFKDALQVRVIGALFKTVKDVPSVDRMLKSRFTKDYFTPLSPARRRIAAECLVNTARLHNFEPACLWLDLAANEHHI